MNSNQLLNHRCWAEVSKPEPDNCVSAVGTMSLLSDWRSQPWAHLIQARGFLGFRLAVASEGCQSWPQEVRIEGSVGICQPIQWGSSANVPLTWQPFLPYAKNIYSKKRTSGWVWCLLALQSEKTRPWFQLCIPKMCKYVTNREIMIPNTKTRAFKTFPLGLPGFGQDRGFVLPDLYTVSVCSSTTHPGSLHRQWKETIHSSSQLHSS